MTDSLRITRALGVLLAGALVFSACTGEITETPPDRPMLMLDSGPPGTDAGPGSDAGPPVDPPPPPPSGCGTPEELAVIELANQARASMGLGALTCDPLMTQVARAHSQDMCDNGYFSHTSQDGRSPFDRMRDAGVDFGGAGENIAQGQRNSDAVHEAWMNSSGHRANILNGGYGRIGVGLAECGGRMFWTQVFAN